MSHYVYRTKRGLLRTVQATDGCAAWRLADLRHTVAEVHDLTGATWRYSAAIPGPHRDEGVYITPEQAQALYLDACAAEVPAAVEELPRLARSARDVAIGLLRMCAARGLVLLFPVVPQPRLTELGRAFVARTEGGA